MGAEKGPLTEKKKKIKEKREGAGWFQLLQDKHVFVEKKKYMNTRHCGT